MAQRIDPRRLLVVAVNDEPRGVRRIGLREHLVHRGKILITPGSVAIVIDTGFPALPRIVQSFGETFVLFVLRDVDKQLNQRDAHRLDLTLEGVDFVIGAAPLFGLREAFDAFDQHATIP